MFDSLRPTRPTEGSYVPPAEYHPGCLVGGTFVVRDDGRVLRVFAQAGPPRVMWIFIAPALIGWCAAWWLGFHSWFGREDPLKSGGFWIFLAFALAVPLGLLAWFFWTFRRQARSPDLVVVDRGTGEIRLPRRGWTSAISTVDGVEQVFIEFLTARAWPEQGIPTGRLGRAQSMRTHLVLRLKKTAESEPLFVLIDAAGNDHAEVGRAIARACGVSFQVTQFAE